MEIYFSFAEILALSLEASGKRRILQRSNKYLLFKGLTLLCVFVSTRGLIAKIGVQSGVQSGFHCILAPANRN